MNPLKILCVHGVGRHAPGEALWQDVWRTAIRAGVQRFAPDAEVEFRFVEYDHLFARNPPNTLAYLRAVAELLAGRFGFGARGVSRGDLARQVSIRWSAGMVAQWVTDDRLRRATRQLLLDAVRDFAPQAVVAHSLGSLVAYDTFRLNRADQAVQATTLITPGSQIGNPFVANEFGGRVAPLTTKQWYHVYNPNDRVFTAPLRIVAANFEQIDATFGRRLGGDLLNHDLDDYLKHPNVVQGVWRRLVAPRPVRAPFVTATAQVPSPERPPDRKALLVGINDYPRPEDRLEGCVNDAFRLSATLQECNFQPDDIRLLLNDRATADEIRTRLEWLLDDVREGDVRFFGYSGHGAQLPAYGPNWEPDGFDECLVPWDCDWSRRETLVLDDWIYDLYSQIPYGVQFVMFLDCCHSGGLTRAGGPKVRMISPPDDIRHRALRWDAGRGMWVRRDLPDLIPVSRRPKWNVEDYIGSSRSTRRFGRAVRLRQHDDRTFDRLRKEYDHNGPYLPMIMQACQEHQVAFEYHDGAAAYGAFTFTMTKLLRDLAQRGNTPTFDGLCRQTSALLREIGYDQDPLIVGPRELRQAKIPFGPRPRSPARRRTARRRPRARS
jgi:hypothetical protein